MNLRSFAPMGCRVAELCSEVAAAVSLGIDYDQVEGELIIVAPEEYAAEVHVESPHGFVWKEIYRAWQTINHSAPEETLDAWRVIYKHGEELGSGMMIFRLRNTEIPSYYYILSHGDLYEASARLKNLLFPLSVWHHIAHGRCLFHAAGIVYRNSAYLFSGSSGIGKSTIASLSAQRGCDVIHDDHVVVYPTREDQGYLVTDVSQSTPGVLLSRIFFPIQDTVDQVFQISPFRTAERLLKSLFDIGGHQILHGHILADAFAIATAIARSVPGYELHFRKSPDFWNVIDAELGN